MDKTIYLWEWDPCIIMLENLSQVVEAVRTGGCAGFRRAGVHARRAGRRRGKARAGDDVHGDPGG